MNRFWSKVDIKGPDECWEWQASFHTTGYGQIKYNKKKWKAHRVSWILTNGEISNALCVLHKCDNPKCVNPNHLFLGTLKENTQDMLKKNRGRWKDRKKALQCA